MTEIARYRMLDNEAVESQQRLPGDDGISDCRAARFAYGAAILFAAHLLTYFIPAIRDMTLARSAPLAIALATLAVAQHLVVFPVVASVPTARWARMAAYMWLVVDMGTELVQLGGASKSLYLPIRLAVNVLAAVWYASASWRAHGAMRNIGLFVAFDVTCYSLVASFSPLAFVVALPSLVLLPVWFALVGRWLTRQGIGLVHKVSTHIGS